GMTIQSTPVSFGAVGTPILVGVNGGLGDNPKVLDFIRDSGFVSADGELLRADFLIMIGGKVALLHAIVGTLIPLIVVTMMTGFFGANRSFLEGLKVWKFALFAAFAMTMPYLAVAWFLGPEFPSLIGGLVGLAIVVTAARRGFLIPRDQPWDFGPRDTWNPEWTGTVTTESTDVEIQPMSLVRAWLPYVLLAVLLVVTRVPALHIVDFLKAPEVTINLPNLFGTSVSSTTQILYLPGTVFIVVSLLASRLHGMNRAAYGRAWRQSGSTIVKASVALVFTVPMVQVFINSGGGAEGYAQMPKVLAEAVSSSVGTLWPIFSPFIGGFGAFVAGSNTVSNMMFSLFQFQVGDEIGANPSWIVALQAVGGAAGNTICVHNVVAASAVVGLMGKEGAVIRKTLVVFVYYALAAGIIGYMIAGVPS
ncbi:MAG: L-lactate permease, partial [Planctomycetota bacterium]|nr:L-lactate permease [Planctomycetota bacterium]